MNRSLVVRCSKCDKVTSSLDARRSRVEILGDAVRRAEADGQNLELASGTIEIGCDCQTDAEPQVSRSPLRWNLKQMLLVVTAIAILVTVFRHPIGMIAGKQTLADERVLKAAASPWSVYGWLFMGTPIINPKTLGKSPLVIMMLLANVALAGMTPFAIGWAAKEGFQKLWRLSEK